MHKALCLGLLACLATQAHAAPQIKFDRTLYDFGATSLVESVTGTFTFQNTGDAVLEIQKPKPSCGCTVARVSPDTLPPGEKGELVFTLNVGTVTQTFEKQIYVPSNDPTNSSVELHIKVVTKSVFTTEPAGVSLGGLSLGATTNVTVIVRRNDGKDLSISKVESSSDLIHATPEAVGVPDPKSQRLRVEVAASGRPRHLSEQIRIFTEDSIGAALRLSVSARLLGDIRLDPEALSWGMPDPAHWSARGTEVILSRRLTVTAVNPGQSLTLSNLTSSVKEMNLKLETLEENRKYLIEARLTHRLTQPLRGTITFDTNLPKLPKVEIPVEVSVWKD